MFVDFKMHRYHILKGSCYVYLILEFKMHPYRRLEWSGSILPNAFEVCGIPGAPQSHSGGVRVNFTECFWSVWNSRCTPIAFWTVQGRLHLVFLKFVEFQVHPYRILEGSGWMLLSVFEFCGIPVAPLSHFGRVRVNFTKCFWGLRNSRCNPIAVSTG